MQHVGLQVAGGMEGRAAFAGRRAGRACCGRGAGAGAGSQPAAAEQCQASYELAVMQQGKARCRCRHRKQRVQHTSGVSYRTAQDTGTAIVMGKRGQYVWTDGRDEEALSKGIFRAYTQTNLRWGGSCGGVAEGGTRRGGGRGGGGDAEGAS